MLHLVDSAVTLGEFLAPDVSEEVLLSQVLIFQDSDPETEKCCFWKRFWEYSAEAWALVQWTRGEARSRAKAAGSLKSLRLGIQIRDTHCIHLSVYLPSCRAIYPSIYLSIYPSAGLSI